MSVSTPWTNSTPASTARNNKVTIISDTGTNLAALDKTKHRAVFCTATGGGLTVNHLYLVNAAQDAFIDLGVVASHTHTSSTDGGSFIDIIVANPKAFILGLTKTDELLKANWIQTVTSTGVITDDTDGTTLERSVKLDSGATSGASATISYPHLKLDFSVTSIYQTKLRIGTATSLALHTGVGADDITAADSNTRKYQAEVCTATNSNWWLRTASGSANSASDTGIAITANRVAIKIIHYPTLGTPRVDLQVDTGTLLQKTTNIPTSGATAEGNIIKHSLKNSTAASRTMFVYDSRLQYIVSDNWV